MHGSGSGSGSGGFTLLEIMVAITVAAILLAIAVPSLTMFIQNSRETSEADSLVASLDYARSEAVKLDANVEVCASTDEMTCSGSVAPGGWAGGWIVFETVGAGTTVLQVMPALGAGNTLSSAFDGANVSEVTFQANGFVQAAAGAAAPIFQPTYFTLCDTRGAGYARDIEVSATGAIQAAPTADQTMDNPPEPLSCP